jgi:hypothetical protein
MTSYSARRFVVSNTTCSRSSRFINTARFHSTSWSTASPRK